MKKISKKTCETCGKDFEITSRNYRKRFCNRSCANKNSAVLEKMRRSQEETYRKKYGVSHPMKTTQVVENFKNSMKEKYGVEHALQSDEILEKSRKTKMDNHGNPTFVNPDKARKTCLEKYGVDNVRKTPQYKEKYRETCLKKYGRPHASKTEKFKIYHFTSMFEKFLKNERFTNFTAMFSLEDYKGVDGHTYKFKCNRCGRIDNHSIEDGKPIKCVNCDKTSMSYFQKEIYDFIHYILGTTADIKKNTRSVIPPLELDIFVPDLKIAIECNGLFWHSEILGRKYKNYHLNKTQKCNEKYISLIHIMEYEWKNKQSIVESILRNYFNKNEIKIAARQCNIKEIKPKESNEFLNLNHIQGADRASIRYGLYYNEKLVSVMTFCKSRYDKKCQYEMSRYCNKLNTTIVGGAAKLFSNFVKDKSPTSVVSYNDRRYFTGSVYRRLGFDFIHNSPPNYFYIIDNYSNVRGRMEFQKHKLKNILPKFDTLKSEWENMKNNGFDRIWDCGNGKWVWINHHE